MATFSRMKKGRQKMDVVKFIFIASFWSFACFADRADDEIESLKKELPKEAQALADRMEGCAHWSGEEPFDAKRGADIERHLKSLKCNAIEKDEATILKKFKAKKAKIEKVFEYSKIGPG